MKNKYIVQKIESKIDLVNNKKYDFYAYVIFVKENDRITPILFNEYTINSADSEFTNNIFNNNSIITNKNDNFIKIGNTNINKYRNNFD